MKRKVFFWFLFVLIVTGVGISSAENSPLTGMEEMLIPEELLPMPWSTVASQTNNESGNLQFSQHISSQDAPVNISYFIYLDPQMTVFDGSNSFSFDFDRKDIEVTLESEAVVFAKFQKIKKDEPQVPHDENRVIRMFAHFEGFTFMVYSDSWVLLERAGDPETLLKDILKAGLDTASNLDLEEIAKSVPTTTITQKTSDTSSTMKTNPTLIFIVALLVAIPIIWLALRKKR